MSPAATLTAFAGVLMAALCGDSFAQTTERPSRATFGGASTEGASAPDALTALTVTLAEGYDDNLAADAGGPTQYAVGGAFTSLTGDFNLHSGSPDLALAASAGTDLRYYPGIDRVVGIGHRAGVGLDAALSRTTSLSVSQTVAYTPSYLYQLFPAVAAAAPGQVAVGRDYVAGDQRSLLYGTTASLARELGPRDTLTAQATGEYTHYTGGDPLMPDLWNYEVGATWAHHVSRTKEIRTGYTFRRYDFLGIPATEHGVVFGLAADRPVSRSRRFSYSLTVGSALLNGPVPGALTTSLTQQFRLTGDASIARQFGRTWEARAAYHRGVGYIDGMTSLIASDGFTLASSGLLGRRVDVALMAAYSNGEPIEPLVSRDRFTTYTGTSRVRIALTSTLATYAEYLYYHYEFPPQMLVAAGLPAHLTRNGVRGGLMAWIPLTKR